MKKRVHVSAANDKVSVAHLSPCREILVETKHLREFDVVQTKVIRFLTHEKALKMPLKPL